MAKKLEQITGSKYGDLMTIISNLTDPSHLNYAMGLCYCKPVGHPIIRDLYRTGVLVMYKHKNVYFVTLKINTEVRLRQDDTPYRYLCNEHGGRGGDKLFSDEKALDILNKLIKESEVSA